MDNETTGLVTAIVSLITAVVGLITAILNRPRRKAPHRKRRKHTR